MSESRTLLVVDIDETEKFTSREQFEGLIATPAGRLLYAEFGIRSYEDYLKVKNTMESRARDLGIEIPVAEPLARPEAVISAEDRARLTASIETAAKEEELDPAAWLKAAKKRSAIVEAELRARRTY
jgi:hypothetical protein